MRALQIIFAGIVLLLLYAAILPNWRRGLDWLLVYLPFAGLVTLALHFWPPSILFKDVLFVVPVYVAFFARLSLGYEDLAHFPKSVAYLIFCLTVLVLLQCANVGVANMEMALIGAKVWLFYLPLCFVAFAFIDSERRLITLLRLLVVLSFIPVGLALAELVLIRYLGIVGAMERLYGLEAAKVTQGFTDFQVGRGSLARIPSTFTFVAQFFGYSLATMVPTYIVWRRDPSTRWRLAGGVAFIAVAMATFLSGARAAYIFTPLLIVLIFVLDGGVTGLLVGAAGSLAFAWIGATAIVGASLSTIYALVGHLSEHYGSTIAYSYIVRSLSSTPFGVGTGTNTGAARYALANPASFLALENYYAKAVHELGVPGLLVVVALFLAVILAGFGSRHLAASPLSRSAASAFLSFAIVMFLNSFKGWQIDLDPIDVYYWVFAGVLMKLCILRPTTVVSTPANQATYAVHVRTA